MGLGWVRVVLYLDGPPPGRLLPLRLDLIFDGAEDEATMDAVWATLRVMTRGDTKLDLITQPRVPH